MKSRTSWRAKLEKEQERKLVDDPKGKGKMLIPKPLDVDTVVRQVRQGKMVTLDQLRGRLAKDYAADLTCPLCTGIFLRICAETAEEDLMRGIKDIAPYWRVVKNDGSLNEKFPGGVEAQANRLRDEGHALETGKGRKLPRVKDFGKALQDI